VFIQLVGRLLKLGSVLFMFANHLKCVSCDATFPLVNQYECSECGNILEIEYSNKIFSEINSESRNFFYCGLLPIDRNKIVSIGEGRTPFIKSKKIAKKIGLK